MRKVCEIDQPYGLGDILLCEPIARHYHNLGYKILYWAKDEYIWIKDYIPYINFKKMSEGYVGKDTVVMTEDFIYLPLMRKAITPYEEWVNTGWLYDKYIISELDPLLWKTFTFVRNTKKEGELYNHLGLGNRDYILVNRHSSAGKRDLKIESDYKIVDMEYVEGYTMLDWYKVMMGAKELHMVSTSTLMPAVHMNHKNITIYRRVDGPDNFISIKSIFEDYDLKYESPN